ncbi:Udp-glycosyltransferase 89a2 [Thalictrum thalictroides]|uniref:Udp-glycosyltransferase 89a2 n=1 Tax=Thalictrum thalictroides TaxID=46969 RepID=A0A7J6VAC7_THATH|nr:Udp-glycosyltransferase 89a2 [Thalictrum thalictroides]
MSLPNTNTTNTNTHILVFPFPAQGHMIALLDLAHQLSLQGITITILITPKNLPILQPLLTKNPFIQTLVLPFPSHHPSIPAGVENVKDIGNNGNFGIINALIQLSDPITHWFKSHPTPPIAIISDFFLGWTQQLATQLGIPRITFYSSGAFSVCVLTYLMIHLRELYPLDEVSFPHLPKSPVFNRAHLPSAFKKYREEDPLCETVKDGLIANTSSWGAVFNTFDDVETAYLESFKNIVVGHERVWAVGPIQLLGCSNGPAATDRGGASSVSAVDVFSWLDQYSDASSVVYVCFGSQVFLTRGQMEALTKGLEESGVQFIIVVNSETFIPEGFEDRVAGRGFVIKGWAPQVSILSHHAVGGFLTHCGWNSVLEGIVAGVMLFAWPMEADQFINARLLVDDMGVAVKVCEGIDTVPDSAELARCLKGSMSEKVGAMKLRDKALGAVKEGGSSMNDLNSMVKELHALSM